MIYKKDITGDDSICSASAFEHGYVIIMIRNHTVTNVENKKEI